MIRDPSDGSVREPKKSAPDLTAPQNNAERSPSVMPDCSGADTGLPDDYQKLDQSERLKRSREWLKDYHARRTALR